LPFRAKRAQCHDGKKLISHFVTIFGDGAILVPLSGAVFVYLIYTKQLPLALEWALTIGICLLMTLCAKLLLLACGAAVPQMDLRSPSGHVSFSAVFYGCAAVLAGGKLTGWKRYAIGFGVTVLIILIGVSRVRIGAHSTSETIAGFLIGLPCVAIFAYLRSRGEIQTDRLIPITVILFLWAFALQQTGIHFSAERWIGHLLVWLGGAPGLCRLL
jgi:membrane-associated phospholipid phosphatase